MTPTGLASLNQLVNQLPQTQVEAKTILLNQGDTATAMLFVRQGCVRACFNDDGNVVTTQFFLEGQVATALDSFMTQTPSQFSLETVEPSHLSVLTKQAFDHLLATDRSFHDWFYQTALQKLIEHTNRLLSFIKNSPQERYAQLVEQQPELLSRFPQHYIASYLGVTPVSFSPIKNRKKVPA